jgi:hypothetical protein
VEPDGVIEIGNVRVHVATGFLMIGVGYVTDSLGFQAAKKTFNWRIIPTIFPSAHALYDALVGQDSTESCAGVLAALVRMEE